MVRLLRSFAYWSGFFASKDQRTHVLRLEGPSVSAES